MVPFSSAEVLHVQNGRTSKLDRYETPSPIKEDKEFVITL